MPFRRNREPNVRGHGVLLERHRLSSHVQPEPKSGQYGRCLLSQLLLLNALLLFPLGDAFSPLLCLLLSPLFCTAPMCQVLLDSLVAEFGALLCLLEEERQTERPVVLHFVGHRRSARLEYHGKVTV